MEPDDPTHSERITSTEREHQSSSDDAESSSNECTIVSPQENSPRPSPSISQRNEPGKAIDPGRPPTIFDGENIDATHLWWYLDFAGAAVAIICMVLIAATLLEADGKQLAKWPLVISPNTIVSILTTITRTALLVPLGSSISQLKWRHLLLKARPLEHLQLFDSASRGPWGSLLMIRHLLLQSKIACALSLATILTLGISPSAQQILEYPTLDQELPGLDISIGRADEYFSKGFRQLPNQSSLTGYSFQPQFHCPAEGQTCEWEGFSTLAVCRTFRNVTEEVTRKCDNPGSSVQNCNYTIPLGDDRLGEEDQLEMWMTYIDHDATQSSQVSAVLNTTFIPSTSPDGWIGQFIVIRHHGRKWDRGSKWMSISNPTLPHIFLTSFRWCQKAYQRVKAVNGTIQISDDDVKESFFKPGQVVDTDEHNAFDSVVFETEDGRNNYRLTTTLIKDLPTYLSYLFRTQYGERPGSRATNETSLDSAMQMQHLLYRFDIANLTKSLEAVLTDQARSSNPGDNYNATMFTTGRAFGSVTCIRVRWVWFAMPVATVVLSLGLFVTTVILTRQTPLLKDSLLALLFYPLTGWAENEVYVNGPQTSEKLQKLASNLYGRLEIGANKGRYEIVKDEVIKK
ncbi:hypothetical protein LX36DRAFT_586463 [Colletotrichum falcatum]|nr:hypothetical protein LX36DRAFT_586463 [Colletotrichum falcatum]